MMRKEDIIEMNNERRKWYDKKVKPVSLLYLKIADC